MLRLLPLSALAVLLFSPGVHSQEREPLSVPPDSPRWDLQGQAKAAEYQGRKCLLIDGGAAILKDFAMRDAVIDVDVATPAVRGFFGFDVRIDADGTNLRQVVPPGPRTDYPFASRDGKWVYYQSGPRGATQIYRCCGDGSGAVYVDS